MLDARQHINLDALTEALWENQISSAAANVRNYVALIRGALRSVDERLGDSLLTVPGNGVGLKASYQLDVDPEIIDVHTFRALATQGQREFRARNTKAAAVTLERALQLWRGPAGIDVAGSSRLRRRLDALDEQRIGTQECLMFAQFAQGHASSIIPNVRDVLAADPLREPCWMLLMKALYAGGSVSAALNAYQQARTALSEELGIEPSSELQELHVAILRGDEVSSPQMGST
ncbi:AfsR/SARP family transcriptional regulator [Micromonospora sp. LAH09]|uniref:AfsR/SARP family transcriptional regulator n=1 Tax=Micromonospora cabrerizensis TaxID=2911213 RepID=UPI001EE8EDE7|nr:AfsR/SARP family transcriptional regulator [Micromonospora cabrerizensis]MCG5473033.1 AfsR/SARP family transcriptional regulator [Micromonospora cabrerizensis]